MALQSKEESKRLLNNATANISPQYKKLESLLAEAAALRALEDLDLLDFAAFKEHLLRAELITANTAQIKKSLHTLHKHLTIQYKLQPSFLDTTRGGARSVTRKAIFKELLGLTPPDILKEYI